MRTLLQEALPCLFRSCLSPRVEDGYSKVLEIFHVSSRGNQRPANQGRMTRSSQPRSFRLLLLSGSAVMPLQISPTETTLA